MSLKNSPHIHDTDAWQDTQSLFHVLFFIHFLYIRIRDG